MTDLKKLRELAEKATPGPKYFTVEDTFPTMWLVDEHGDYHDITNDDLTFWESFNPQAIIELLDRLERYEKALRFYAKDSQFSTGEKMTDSQKRDMDDYGSRAREALEGEK